MKNLYKIYELQQHLSWPVRSNPLQFGGRHIVATLLQHLLPSDLLQGDVGFVHQPSTKLIGDPRWRRWPLRRALPLWGRLALWRLRSSGLSSPLLGFFRRQGQLWLGPFPLTHEYSWRLIREKTVLYQHESTIESSCNPMACVSRSIFRYNHQDMTSLVYYRGRGPWWRHLTKMKQYHGLHQNQILYDSSPLYKLISWGKHWRKWIFMAL